jgi:hypothetical protein
LSPKACCLPFGALPIQNAWRRRCANHESADKTARLSQPTISDRFSRNGVYRSGDCLEPAEPLVAAATSAMIETARFDPWQVAFVPAVLGHFGKLFDASEEQFACVNKEPSASAQPAAFNLSAV